MVYLELVGILVALLQTLRPRDAFDRLWKRAGIVKRPYLPYISVRKVRIYTPRRLQRGIDTDSVIKVYRPQEDRFSEGSSRIDRLENVIHGTCA
jgi:hypothetical protein